MNSRTLVGVLAIGIFSSAAVGEARVTRIEILKVEPAPVKVTVAFGPDVSPITMPNPLLSTCPAPETVSVPPGLTVQCSVAAPVQRMSKKNIQATIPSVIAAAEAISRRLGYLPSLAAGGAHLAE